ncbi:hypothetical protein NQZ68_003896 [Dissostichus eleginoides]|nr:hypothetical protein NQZ68_003896 [Dissostichus eleginoides]
MEQAAGRGPRLVQSWPAPLQNERLSPGLWGGGTAGGGGGALCERLHQSRSRHPSDRHLGRTTGREERGAGGGVMRPAGSVIRSVAERKMTAPRPEERQVPVGRRPQPLCPLGLTGTGGTCQSVSPPCFNTLS